MTKTQHKEIPSLEGGADPSYLALLAGRLGWAGFSLLLGQSSSEWPDLRQPLQM